MAACCVGRHVPAFIHTHLPRRTQRRHDTLSLQCANVERRRLSKVSVLSNHNRRRLYRGRNGAIQTSVNAM